MLGVKDFFNKFKSVFSEKEPPGYTGYGSVVYNQSQYYPGSDRSILASIYNRIAIDVASISFKHVRVDSQGRYVETMDSFLEECLTLNANVDQNAQAFMIDATLSMLNSRDGVVALVPVLATSDIRKASAFDVKSLRTGTITNWYPRHVEVDLYNDHTGEHQKVTLPKCNVAIIENPLRTIMNAPNSTLSRLKHKLSLTDQADSAAASNKLDLIVQLPYATKSDARKEIAKSRQEELKQQLLGSEYGIAYIDATEKITQLNRPVASNLSPQIEFLMKQLYAQLGLNDSVFSGTATPEVMQNYYNRTVKPIVVTFCQEMERKFLTKTARTQGQRIRFFREPFDLMPASQFGQVASTLIQNQILSPNEVRASMGYKPSDEPQADSLLNPNVNPANIAQNYNDSAQEKWG